VRATPFPSMSSCLPRISLLCAWYDVWVGVYWDAKRRKLYVLPIPCIGFVLTFASPIPAPEIHTP